MYETYYGLKEKPFSIQPDADFIYFGRRHAYAYAMMEYAVKNRAGFTVISGEIGCGKTTLVRHLLNNLEPSHTVGLVYNTHKDIKAAPSTQTAGGSVNVKVSQARRWGASRLQPTRPPAASAVAGALRVRQNPGDELPTSKRQLTSEA